MAPIGQTKVRFYTDADLKLKRTLDAMAIFRGLPTNDLYLRLLRIGVAAELQAGQKCADQSVWEPGLD